MVLSEEALFVQGFNENAIEYLLKGIKRSILFQAELSSLKQSLRSYWILRVCLKDELGQWVRNVSDDVSALILMLYPNDLCCLLRFIEEVELFQLFVI